MHIESESSLQKSCAVKVPTYAYSCQKLPILKKVRIISGFSKIYLRLQILEIFWEIS